MKFPKRIYTEKEVDVAKKLIDEGHKHRLRIEGSKDFQRSVKTALDLVKVAGYYDFLKTYIRKIEEIDGITQLRQATATIWANRYAVENPVDAASLLIQKANSMKEYLQLKPYFGGIAEKRSDEKRIEFLKVLKTKTESENVKEECARLLKMWEESSLAY